MKRILVIILCICIVMMGCKRNVEGDNKESVSESNKEDNNPINEEDPNENTGNNTIENSGDNKEETDTSLLKLSTEWSSAVTAGSKNTAYVKPNYEALVKPYQIEEGLTNIENIDQFSGFTKEQTAMLKQNGFVVLPSNNTRIYYVYDTNEYLGVPNFITADSVLHLYHQFYDKSLLSVESDFLYEDLELMTKQMLEKSIQLHSELKEEDLKTLQEKNIIYFCVARMLMQKSSEIEADVDSDLLEIAKSEYALIEGAEGYTNSPLLNTNFDYSQFKVRGHYTKSEEMGRFFKTMMWFGTAPVSLINKNKEVEYENTLQALLIAFTTFLESGETCNAELWSNIYLPTGQYVGLSDDINVFTMNNLRLSVFGEGNDPNIFNDEAYKDKLIKEVKALPNPKIQADLKVLTTPTDKQFRFMGQRYILDSYILQTLTESFLRPIPSALDVMGVMGSNLARDLLFDVYKPQESWPEYEEKYKELEKEVSGYTSETWGNNLYNGWLWSIQEAMTEFDTSSGMPLFMTTDAWKYKSLNSALGSYTELKHDTVLYGKQSVAEMGDAYETADQQYVEPNIALYSKLLYLTDYTVAVLEDRGMINESFLEGANAYKELLTFLIGCSAKELRNEVLTEEENKKLLWYGGTLENISNLYLQGLTGDYATKEISDMLVADIHTYQNSYLSQGTGYFDDIYVIVPINGKLYLSRGAVYSYYEFVSDTRLTDEEWWELQGIKVIHEEYGDYPEYTEESEDLPDQPFWVDKFKTDSNGVMIEPLEIDW